MARFQMPKLRPRHKKIIRMVFENRFRLLMAMGCSLIFFSDNGLVGVPDQTGYR